METKVMANMPSQIPTFKTTNYFAEQQSAPSTPSPPTPNFTIPDSWPFLYGNPQLDFNKESILGQYIHKIYCRECREQENMAAANQAERSPPDTGSVSPQYQMDQLSISSSMDANKESLKRKLMVRRSVHELVDQGIYPPLKSPAAFAEQRLHLQRAQTGDRLNKKIQSRPDRQSLVEQHILEDSNADPSLHEKQRQLKKAKLTDQLNDKIAHRPGPLELVEHNILQVEDKLAHAIKEGKLDFTKTDEGVDGAPVKLPYEVESPKSGTSSPEPLDCDNDSNTGSISSGGFTHIPSPPDITPLLTQVPVSHVTIGGKTIPITTQSFLPTQTVTVAPQQLGNQVLPRPSNNYPSNRRNNRKQKTKPQQKQRVIKFHEYKGPPQSAKSGNSATPSSSFLTTVGPPVNDEQFTPYHFSLQQQHLLLQCQVEIQSSQETIPTVLAVPVAQQSPSIQQELSPPKQLEQPSRPSTPVHQQMKSPPVAQQHKLHPSLSMTNLEDLKVADLKMELKQRHLPVSGSKPQLIERLRGHQTQQESSSGLPSVSSDLGFYPNTPSVQSFTGDDSMNIPPMSVASSHIPSSPNSPVDDSHKSPPSLLPFGLSAMDVDDGSQGAKHAEIVKQQQKKIEELQRALRESQQKLQLVQQPFVMPQQPIPMQPSLPLQSEVDLNSQPTNQLQELNGNEVLFTTPDGKTASFKVVPIEQANPFIQMLSPPSSINGNQSSATVVASNEDLANSSAAPTTETEQMPTYDPLKKTEEPSTSKVMNPIDVDDVLEILIRTGEMAPSLLSPNFPDQPLQTSQNQPLLSQQKYDDNASKQVLEQLPKLHIDTGGDQLADINLPESLSPLMDMDWMEADSSQNFLDGLSESPLLLTERTAPNSELDNENFDLNENGDLDWLSDVIHQQDSSMDTASLSLNPNFTSDPVLTPKTQDVLNIFNMEESDFRTPTDASNSNISWDKLIGQTTPRHL